MSDKEPFAKTLYIEIVLLRRLFAYAYLSFGVSNTIEESKFSDVVDSGVSAITQGC